MFELLLLADISGTIDSLLQREMDVRASWAIGSEDEFGR